MRNNKAASTTSLKHTIRQLTLDDVTGAARVLAAVWCRSVGTSWTLELHELDGDTARGRVVDRVSSGVPISQPVPEWLARQLLADRKLALFGDCAADPDTHSRHRIGYVCGDAELITLAHLVAEDATKAGVHPVLLAARWVAAGFPADAAAGWIRQGVQSPQAAQHQTVSPQLTGSPTIDHRGIA
ncbi:MAG: hypothetical protein ACRDQ4_01695 [Pseudonocardiaceae bacterium]